jgi:hypothetical protein
MLQEFEFEKDACIDTDINAIALENGRATDAVADGGLGRTDRFAVDGIARRVVLPRLCHRADPLKA